MTNQSENRANMVERVTPAVFQILAGKDGRTGVFIGSGFVIDPRGGAITNAHVIGDNDEVSVFFAHRGPYGARVVYADGDTDLAYIRILSMDIINDPLTAVPMGDSFAIRPGEDAVAFGFPEVIGEAKPGRYLTVSSGIVAGKRNRDGVDYIQTDAAVNPGNSGGPLVNIRGEVIGVCNIRYDDSDNIAFAIAIDEVKGWLENIPAQD